MTILRSLSILTLALVLPAAAVQAEIKIYPYASSENYCPDGLQPVQVNGVISCGTPNQSGSYYGQMR